MDAKMKGMIMSAMMALCLILGAMSIFSDEWLTETETDETGMDVTTNVGLSNYVTTTEYADSDTCEGVKAFYDGIAPDAENECDGAVFSSTMAISELCEMAEEATGEADEDCESTASAGSTGSMIMWVGVLCSLVAALVLILPMAGVDAMDKLPDMAKMITSWGAGGLMLLGVLVWYMMLPDGDSSASTGLFMAIGAAILGLGAPAMDKFMPADE